MGSEPPPLQQLEQTPAPLRELESGPDEGSHLELTPAALREMGSTEDDGRLTALQSALDDAQARAFAAEVRATQFEAQMQESAAQAPGRQEAARRDREILRLKSDLEAAQQAIADLRDQQTQSEQKTLELSGELSRRDSQLKSLGRS
jgi:chromosome segregation ATPase